MVASRAEEELLACLARASEGHRRLCPRQVLGVRIGRYAGALFGLPVPQSDKRLLAFVETDGCAVDGITAATGCTVGRRTMRVVDFGKVAATFVDTVSGRAIRIWPHPDARHRALTYAPEAADRWHAQLDGYRRMPARELLKFEHVMLNAPLAALLGRAGMRVECDACGEEVMNGREAVVGAVRVCRGCAGESYWSTVGGDDVACPAHARSQTSGLPSATMDVLKGELSGSLDAVVS